MPTPPSGGPPVSSVRTSILFKTLLKGRRHKLGRDLTEPELAALEHDVGRKLLPAGVRPATSEPSAPLSSRPSVLSAEERRLVETHQQIFDQRRAFAVAAASHEKARRDGRVPNVSLGVLSETRTALGTAREEAVVKLSFAMNAKLGHDERVEAARAAVAALPRRLEEAAGKAPRSFGRRARRSIGDVAAIVTEVLEAKQVGHRGARGTPGNYLQQEDVNDLIPDGWGGSFPLEMSRLARRAGIPPRAVPMLCLLTWTSSIRPPDADERGRKCGSGLQVSIEWLARKLDCSESYVKVLWNKLDPFAAWRREVVAIRIQNRRREARKEEQLPEPKKPQGTPYIHRFRQLKKYSELPKRDGKRAEAWMDSTGRVRFWCDVRGVLYVTDIGRRLLVRRLALKHRPRPGVVPALRPNGMLTDLKQRLFRTRARLSARLRRGKAGLYGLPFGVPAVNPLKSQMKHFAASAG